MSFENNTDLNEDEVVETLRPMLNSERIEHIFGSYGVDASMHNGVRVSNLYSLNAGGRVPVCLMESPDPCYGKSTRTLALVTFVAPVNPLLETAHHEVTAHGKSLGTTLQGQGWSSVFSFLSFLEGLKKVRFTFQDGSFGRVR